MQCIQIKIETGEWLAVDCGFQAYGICEKHSSEMIFEPPEDCKGPDCCRGHVGAEYGGIIESSAFTSSSDLHIKNSDGKEYDVGAAERGRLNYPTVVNETGAGWYADEKDHAPWLQIDFPDYYEIRGIVTQGGDWGNQALLSPKYRNRCVFELFPQPNIFVQFHKMNRKKILDKRIYDSLPVREFKLR